MNGASHVIRGGSWNNFARSCRSAGRPHYGPGTRYGFLGFRVASLPPTRTLVGGSRLSDALSVTGRVSSRAGILPRLRGFRVAAKSVLPLYYAARGGYWGGFKDGVQAVYRIKYGPDFRGYTQGFRIMTPESRVKATVKRVLSQVEHADQLYLFMPVQRGQGKPGLDFHGTYRGMSFYIETKAPGKGLTPRQEITQEEILVSGAPVFVVHDEQEMGPVLDWIERVDLACEALEQLPHAFGIKPQAG